EAYATNPYLLTRPYVGFSPTIPHMAPGCRMEPPVSEPRANATSPAATAAAEPPLEPPGTREGSHGFPVGPYPLFSVELPMANSSQFVLPIRMAPAASSRSNTVAL